jgi:hypothetical protein
VDRLLAELTAGGILDAGAADWARAHQSEHGGTLDTALLELDLIDEQGLLAGLKSRFERPVATPEDFTSVEPNLGQRVPESFGKSFSICPVRLSGNVLVALVASPLPAESVEELRELFELEVRELVAPGHYIALARQRAYGAPLGTRTLELEARLARRRAAPSVTDVVRAMGRSSTIAASAHALLELGSSLLENCYIFVTRNDELRVVSTGGGKALRVRLPDPGSSIGPAISHGGYFLGPIAGTAADRQFYESLGRDVPRRAFVAPIPSARSGRAVLYADNGPRGIATRWVAELTVSAARFGHKSGEWDEAPAASVPAASSPSAEPTERERLALAKLREAADEAGSDLVAFVDELLRLRTSQSGLEPAAALVGEVKGLFERLATDIPTHLARGMEAAFRDLVPRLSSAQPASVASRPAAPDVTLVQTQAAPREVASYASRRQKTQRIKL